MTTVFLALKTNSMNSASRTGFSLSAFSTSKIQNRQAEACPTGLCANHASLNSHKFLDHNPGSSANTQAVFRALILTPDGSKTRHTFIARERVASV